MILTRLVGSTFLESKTLIPFCFGHEVLCLKYYDTVHIIVILKSACFQNLGLFGRLKFCKILKFENVILFCVFVVEGHIRNECSLRH